MKSQIFENSVLTDIRRPEFISFMNLARWVAAFTVFCGHLRAPLFLGYGSLSADQKGILVKAWYFWTGMHAEAVVIFFVLSGFLVGGVSIAKFSVGELDLRDYFSARLARLYTPLLPALLLTLALDKIGSVIFTGTGLWNHTHPMIREKIVSYPFETLLDSKILLGNFLMTQTFLVPTLGSNTPLWTIAYEFWFYIIFGLFFSIFIRTRTHAFLLLLIATFAVFFLLGLNFVLYFGLWLIGVAVAIIPSRSCLRIYQNLMIMLVIFGLARIGNDFFDRSESLRMLKNYSVALSFASLLYAFRMDRNENFFLAQTEPIHRLFSEFSYSLYLIHYPLMLFLLGVFWKIGGFSFIETGVSPSDMRGVFTYVAIISIVSISAFGFSLFTEQKTARVKSWIKSFVGQRVM